MESHRNTKKCSCGNENNRLPERYCTDCHAKYMREWRKTHKMNPQQKAKDKCRSYASVYLKRGKLKKKPCEVCNTKTVKMFFDDYNKPLEPRWFCDKHHRIKCAEERRRKEPILFSTGQFPIRDIIL